ncbi:RNA polymerase subunit sigma-70 [Cupriavidus sp. USMAA2-4]|uniref:RNA polymerase sigma factor n=1 Tax=Cupriavidus sp. USMAA2-4 TaxID=876364 RepID=UPI0008A6C3DF|nr:RNA polymerase sigma factor [Cupriavidus sp. USMAA2-4]AOY96164.1 RNA polymerase subunit sigma-70 [Cupriavidus sp. USMAA2-4]
MDAFEQQLIRLAPRLRRHARGLTGDGALADDLVQDTLERALRFRWRFHLRPGTWWGDGADGLFPWLLTIMHRLRLNTLRRKDLVAYTDTPPEVAAPETEPGLRLDLEQALAQLPEAQRAVLLMVSLEQLSYAETARVLGIPPGTVMSRLSRARERMRALLGTAPGAGAASDTSLQRVK